jgi:hypothetical protein
MLGARVMLRGETNPRLACPARAEADARTGRGAVIYMRYDGHYGLIESAA